MVEAFNSDMGPCMFRSLLGIAESRVGRNLTNDELNLAKQMYYGSSSYGSSKGDNWAVTTERADGNSTGTPLVDVINIGLELLGSNERASFNGRVKSVDTLPAGTQATILRVSAQTTSGYHFVQGDAMGNLLYDPLGYNSIGDTPRNRVDTFRFYVLE